MDKTRYSPALLAAIRAGEFIDEDRFGLSPRRRQHQPLTLTAAMRADRAAARQAAVVFRRGQFTRRAARSDEHT